jgi:ribosomal protein S18 acetylase RimI-like enzyme
MRVSKAQPEDIPQWLGLAAEVEFLFGLMVDDPGFRRMLERNLQRGTALCVREADSPPGAPLMGALLYSASSAPHYHISWLVVAERWRRHGVGEQLVRHVFDLMCPPAEIDVVTFGPDVVAGQPARRFYERLGFTAAEAAPDGPEGASRQVYRRSI